MRINGKIAYQISIKALWILAAIAFINTANAQKGVGPYALNFDGTNDHVDLGNAIPNGMLNGGSFDNGDVDQTWTFEAYVKIQQNPTDPETLFSVNPSVLGIPYLFNQDRLSLVIDDNPNQQGCRFRYYQEYQLLPFFPVQDVVNFNKDITDGEWHHIAFTYAYDDRDNFFFTDPAHIDIKLYVDGNLVGDFDEASLNTNVQIQNQDYMTLGSNYNGWLITNAFSGKMDEVRFWGDVRTASEISNTKGKTLTGNESDLVGYYPFNQKSGTNVPDEASVANGIGNGTLDNMKPSPSWFASYTIFTWEGTVDNDWNNGDNWRFGGVPKPRDRVYIPDAPNPPSQTNNSAETVEVLNIGNKANPSIGNDVTVQDSLILNSVLEMKSSTLVIEDDAVVKPKGGASNQYVKGTVKKVGDDAFDFPLGGDGHLAKIGISAPNNTSDAFKATYFPKGPSNSNSIAGSHPAGKALKSVSKNRHWDMARVNGTSAVDVTLYWNDQTNGDIINKNALVVAHENANNQWENLGKDTSTGQVSGSGSITKNGVNNFSDFTYGSTSSSQPLPVELLYFRAKAKGDHADLSWATASETHNKHFQVQKQVAGKKWANIGTVEGHGTTIEKQTYDFQDPNVKAGQTYYYRLKQVDFDGSYEYSDVKAVTIKSTQQTAETPFTLYPNPVNSQLNLELRTRKNAAYKLEILSSRGEMVYKDEVAVQAGLLNRKLPVSDLQPGVYVLTLRGKKQVFHRRFIKQ